MFKIYDQVLKNIIHGYFPFIKIFLRIRKDKKLVKKFLKKKYYISCDFCLEIQKYKKKISKLNQPSTYEMILFLFKNFNYFVLNNFTIVTIMFILLLRKFISMIL